MDRVEQAISAISSGNLDPDGWAHSRVMALGLSGQRNPLGSAVLHMIETQSSANAYLAVVLLSGELQRQSIGKSRESVDIARDALGWYMSKQCPICTGRGVLDIEQHQCPECQGRGHRARPSHKPTCDAIGVITQALDWLDGQMAARLRGGCGMPTEQMYKLLVPPRANEHMDEMPTAGAATPKAATGCDAFNKGY